MRTILVTRHLGSLFWAYRASIPYDLMVEHLEPEQVAQGDVVIGTLPVHLAAEVCRRGARYMHLVIDVPAELRGRELRRRDLDRCNARLVEFRVEPAAPVRERAVLAARLVDGGHKVVVAIATDQNVANLPPILHVARRGDSVLWLCSKPSLRERARWAEPVLAALGLRTLQVESDCPTRAIEIPAWVGAHVRPLLPPDHRVVLVANGGLKPMSRAVEEALEGVLDEVLYGETPVPTVVRAPADRRLAASVEVFSARLELPQLLAFTGHEFWRGSSTHCCLWRNGARIGDPGADASFDDLESVAADYERYVKMEARERLDADAIKFDQIRALQGDEGFAVANAMQRWNQAVREAVRSTIRGARGTSIAQLLDAEDLDMPALHQAFDLLLVLGGDIKHHAQAAQRVLRRAAQKGRLQDDDAKALLGAFNATLSAAAEHLGAHAQMGFKRQSTLFGAAIGLLRQAELALQHPDENRVVKPLGERFEVAVAARVLDALERHPPWAAAVSEVWLKVNVAASRAPQTSVAEYDVLLVLKNALLLNIECKAGTIDNKDLDARTAVQGRAVSALAEMWVCSLVPTAKADARWFATAHAVRQTVLAYNRVHLPFTWPGQPRQYKLGKQVFECPGFEETLDLLMRRFVPPEEAKAALEDTAQAADRRPVAHG